MVEDPGSHEVLCACVERKIIELAYFSADRLVLIEHERSYGNVLAVLHRLHGLSWSLYEALVSRLSLVVYGANADVLPEAPVPVRALPCWRQVHDVVAGFDLAVHVSDFVPVVVPLLAEKAMCL